MTGRARSPLVTALAGCVALAIAMGIGRFAFTPVLPLMQDDYDLTVKHAGWLASSNYVGYLLGSLCASAIALRPTATIRWGLVLIAAVTAAMAVTNTLQSWLVLRTAAGFAAAFVFIAVSAWTLEELQSSQRPLLNAAVYSGVGAGSFVAGLACLAVTRFGSGSDEAWIVLGAIALLLTAFTWSRFARSAAEAHQASAEKSRIVWNAAHVRLVLGYGFFGFGYIIPATFLPAMAKQMIADPLVFGWSWPLFGLAAAASTFLLAVLPRSMDLRRAWIAAQLVMAVGVALPAVASGVTAILVSALAVGGTFMVVTAAAMQEARRVAPRHAAALIGVMTSAFAIGQIAGPLTVSASASAAGGFTTPLVIASIVLLCGAALIVRPRGHAALYPYVNTTKDVP